MVAEYLVREIDHSLGKSQIIGHIKYGLRGYIAS